jgi:hypothetical protein
MPPRTEPFSHEAVRNLKHARRVASVAVRISSHKAEAVSGC